MQTKYSTQPLPLISSSGFSARSQYDMQTMSTAVNTGNYASPATSIRGADPVESIMPPEFAKVITTDSVAKAVDEMRRFNKGAVCVFDVTGTQLTGIFTERDVLRVFDDGKSALTTAIETVMTPASKLIIGRPDDSTTSCRIKMVENRIRHLPIVGKDGQVVSMVSMTDIINALNNADLSSNLFGLNLAEVEEQAKDLANRMALESGEESSKQVHDAPPPQTINFILGLIWTLNLITHPHLYPNVHRSLPPLPPPPTTTTTTSTTAATSTTTALGYVTFSVCCGRCCCGRRLTPTRLGARQRMAGHVRHLPAWICGHHIRGLF